MDYEIIDSDRHVIEPLILWDQYLDPKFKDYIPYYRESPFVVVPEHFQEDQSIVRLLPELHIQETPLWYKWGEGIRLEATIKKDTYGPKVAQGTSPESQIQTMEATGIKIANLFPTFATPIVNNENLHSEISVAFASAYNDWLLDYCSYAPNRLLGVGLISRHAPQTMVNELQRIAEFNWTSVVLRPEMIKGRVLGHPEYEPFWERCESLDIAVVIHGGTHVHLPTVGTDRFESHFALHACSHPMEAQMAFLSLLESGVLERHPNLKFAFLEAEASWLPHWLWRLDEICYGTVPKEVANHVKMLPSEYFKRQCWIGFEATEPCLRQVVEMVGADRLLYGTDFPHPDHLQFQLEDLEGGNCSLNSEELRLALEENPKQFFGIPT